MSSLKAYLTVIFFALLASTAIAQPITFQIEDEHISYSITLRDRPELDLIQFRDGDGEEWHTIYRGELHGIVKRPKMKISPAISLPAERFAFHSESENAPLSQHLALIVKTGEFLALTEINTSILGPTDNNIYPFAKANSNLTKVDFSEATLMGNSYARAITYISLGESGTVLSFRADSAVGEKYFRVSKHFYNGNFQLDYQKGFAKVRYDNSNYELLDLGPNGLNLSLLLEEKSQDKPEEIMKAAIDEKSHEQKSSKEKILEAIAAIEKSSVKVADANGKEVSAWQLVSSFVTNMSKEAAAKIYQEADTNSVEKIEDIFISLMKKEIGSVKLLGAPGTGKTTLIDQLVAEILAGKGPKALQETVFLQVNAAALNAGTTYVGTTATKLNAMLELSRRFKIVWVIDEAHALNGFGTHKSKTVDDLELLKAGMTAGYFRMIGMSTDFEWSKSFAGNPAFNERFAEVKLTEPSGPVLRKIFRRWMKKYDFPEVDEKSMELMIRLSSEFNAIGAQPRKGIGLIEQVFSMQGLRGDLHSPTEEEILKAAQKLYNLHPDHFDKAKMKVRLDNLPKALSELVVGQDLAKKALADTLELSIAGVEDKKKPKGRKIFFGPRGQGKTEMVMAFGKALDLPVARIVMTKYTSAGQVEDLKAEIVQALRKNAAAVLFFDEIEKAHSSIQKDLLDLLDSGKFSFMEGNGMAIEVNVRNSYVFMATNAGASYIESLKDKSEYDVQKARESMINDKLNELVMDRMDGEIPFFYLNIKEYLRVVVTHVRSILAVYKENNQDVELRLSNMRGFIEQTVKNTFREKMSNREALTALSASLRLTIAKAANASANKQVSLRLDGDRKPRANGIAQPQAPLAGLRCEKVHTKIKKSRSSAK